MLLWWMGEDQIPCHKFRELLEAFLQCLEWVDGGDETPQPVQVLLGAIGSGVSGGGIVRSQGPMPSSQMAFQTPSSWNPQTPGQRGRQLRLYCLMRTHLLFCGCGKGIMHVQVNWELPYLIQL